MAEPQEYVKKLLKFFSSAVIKDQIEADRHETRDSYIKAHYFMCALNKTDSFLLYADLYTEEDFKIAGMDSSQISDAKNDIRTVPEIFRDKLLAIKRHNIIQTYQEENVYYRMLNGEPPVGDEPITLKDGKKVTELTEEELDDEYLEELDSLRKKYTSERYLYLRHLGKRKIHYYTARNSDNYTLLYFDESIFPDRYTKRIVELYYESLIYCMKVFMSDVYSSYELYSGFMKLLVSFTTIQKFNTEIIKFGIRREFIDMKDLRDFFDSHCVPFNSNIPSKYLKRIVQNMNTLLKYKGTNKVLIDIIDLFGFENMKVFKQYLVKDIRKDDFNKPIFSDDITEMYEMKFVEIPIEERNLSYAFRSSTRVFDYDEVTQSDPFWGGADTDYLKMELLKKEFNHIATKYISITTLFNLTKVSNETCYFINTLNELEERKLLDDFFFINTEIKPSGNVIKLFDAICALQCLMCHRFGYDDNIMYTNTQMASLYGFNFDGDINELINIVSKSEYLSKEYEKFVETFKITEKFKTKRAMIDFFFNNMSIKETLENAILQTRNYEEYKALKNIYNYNMYSKSAREMFKKEDGVNHYNTYVEYLKDRDKELAKYLESRIYNESPVEITKALDEIINSLELYLDSSKLDSIFNGLTQMNGEVIQNYIYTLINHFKSYTTQIDKFDVYYIFNDKFSNTIKLLDDYQFGKKELDNADYVLIDIYEYLNMDKGVQKFDESLKARLDDLLKVVKNKDLDPDLVKIFDKYSIDTDMLELELLYLIETYDEVKIKDYEQHFNVYDEFRKVFSNCMESCKVNFTHERHIITNNEMSMLLVLVDEIQGTGKEYGNNEKYNLEEYVEINNSNNLLINLNIKENKSFNKYNNMVENYLLLEDNVIEKTRQHLNNITLREHLTIEEEQKDGSKNIRTR